MIYVYDILLNWQDEFVLDFFEWDTDDNIENIKRIPVFNIHEDTFNEIYNNIVKIDKDFLKEIYQKTEVYGLNNITKLNYTVIFTDEFRAIAIDLDEHGKIIAKSSLLMEEENEILTIVNKLEKTNINYEIVKTLSQDKFLTKNEYHIKKYLYSEILNSSDVNKLKYLYNEIFDKESNNENIKEDLIASLNQLTNSHKKLFYLLEKCSLN